MSIAAKIAPTARRPPRHLYSVNLKASVGPSLSLYVAQRSSSTVVTRPSGAAVAFLFGPNASPWRSVFRPPLTVPPCVTRHTLTTQIHSPLRSLTGRNCRCPTFFPADPAVVCALNSHTLSKPFSKRKFVEDAYEVRKNRN